MSLTQSSYGTTPDKRPVSLFTFEQASVTVKLTDFGGHILEIHNQTRPLTASEGPVLRSPFAPENSTEDGWSQLATRYLREPHSPYGPGPMR